MYFANLLLLFVCGSFEIGVARKRRVYMMMMMMMMIIIHIMQEEEGYLMPMYKIDKKKMF